MSREHSSSSHAKCENVSSHKNHTDIEDKIESQASLWMMYIKTALLVPSFFSTFLLGPYSDVVGRKIALLLPSVGKDG